MGADNQQERLDARWITEFVDSEGCFHIALNKQLKMTLGWQVLPEFRVVQHQRDEHVLYKLQNYFVFGQVCINLGTRKEFCVRGLENLNKIILFFKEYKLQTSKSETFEIFSQIIELMAGKEHLRKEGIEKIVALATNMNTRKRKQMFQESSETTRRIPI